MVVDGAKNHGLSVKRKQSRVIRCDTFLIATRNIKQRGTEENENFENND